MPFCPTDLCETCWCCMEVSCRSEFGGCHIEKYCGLCEQDFAESDERVRLMDGDEQPFFAHKRCA